MIDMRLLSLLPTLFLAAQFLAPPCAAQDQQMVTLRFVSFPKAISHEPLQLRLGEGEVIDVKARSNSISKPYLVPGMTKWSIGTVELDQDQKPVFKEYGAAPSIASKEQLILLIRKGEKNSDGLQVLPMNAAADNFAGGGFFFMNTTRVDIAGILGGTKFTLKPGAYSFIKPGEVIKREKEGAEQLFTRFFYKRSDDQVKEFFSSKWPANKKARNMVFFYHDDRKERLSMHTIRDFMP